MKRLKIGEVIQCTKQETNKGIAVCLIFIALLLGGVYVYHNYFEPKVQPIEYSKALARSIFEGTMFGEVR